MFLFKKRKKESVAIPFLISMIITLMLVGIPVMKLYTYLIENKTSNSSLNNTSIFEPSEENNTTILMIFDTDNSTLRDTFAILRTSAIDKSLIFIPISNDVLNNGKKMSEIFKKGGAIELKKAVAGTYNINIDRYMTFNDEALTILCDVLGGVNYNVPNGMRGMNVGMQYLNSEYIIKLISNPNFAEDARTVTVGSLFSDMISQASGTRIADNIDYTFNKLINVVKTDISSIDFSSQRKAIEYIFRSNQYKVSYRVPSGTADENGGITPDSKSVESIKSELGL